MRGPALLQGDRVKCVAPVNGLDPGELYRIDQLRREAIGFIVVVIRDSDLLVPEGGRPGYFAWRFEPAE